MPVVLSEHELFAQWMGLFNSILMVQVNNPLDMDKSDWPERPVWKAKKWVCHILRTMAERYGTVTNVEAKYQSFAVYYEETWAKAVLNVLLTSIQTWVGGTYMPPKVLALHLKYLDAALTSKVTWRMIKPMVPVRWWLDRKER